MENYLYFFIWLVNVTLLFFQARRDLLRKSPFIFFWIGLCAIFLFPSLSDIFIARVSAHPMAVVYNLSFATLLKAQLICFCFLAIYSLLDVAFYKKNIDLGCFDFFVTTKDRPIIFICWVLLLLIFSLFLHKFLVDGVAFFSNYGFAENRNSGGLFQLVVMAYGLKVVSVLGIFIWLFYKKIYFFSFLVLFFLIFFVFGGSRQPIIYFVAPFVAAFLFSRKYKFFSLVVTTVLLYFSSGIFEILVYLRNLGGFDDRVAALLNFNQILSDAFLRPDPASVRFAFYYFIENGHNILGFFQFSYMLRLFLFWLPSGLDFLSIKPPDFEYTMFSAYMSGHDGTMHPTFLGSIFADSGWFFFLWCIVFFFVVFLFINVLSKSKGMARLVLWAAIAGGAIMWARGSIYAPTVVDLFGVILISIGYFLYFIFYKRRVYK